MEHTSRPLDAIVRQAQESQSSVRLAAAALRASGLPELHVRRIEWMVARARSSWVGDLGCPSVVVLSSMQDHRCPEAVREADRMQLQRGAQGPARAFVHGQSVYLVAQSIATLREAACELAHEVVAHWGLKRLWGDRLDDLLDTVARQNAQQVLDKALRYGLDPSDPRQLREAAEEILADIAAEDRDPTMQEIMDARSRALARQLFPDLQAEPFNRAELLVNVIAPVRDRLQGKTVTMGSEDRPSGDGFYFTPDLAYPFIRDIGKADGGTVMPVYLSIRNPAFVNASEIETAGLSFSVERYAAKGHDGVVYADNPADLEQRGYFSCTQIVAFYPDQIKSALGNNGNFDRADHDIRFSRFSRAAAADPERALAEQRAADLGADPAEVALMEDDELRHTLWQLSRTPGTMSAARRGTLDRLLERAGAEHDEDSLEESFGLRVADDGLIEAQRLDAKARELIGDLPVALYHHTSSALTESIARQGLLVGKPTNFFNTQAGVYLSTIAAGPPVSIYSARAARVHGGEPVTLRVRRHLWQITPDPDDADLAWAQGRQFVTPSVPTEDILWDQTPPAGQDRARPSQATADRSGMGLATRRRSSPWFKGSAVVDADGRPKTLYHGTSSDFTHFARNDRGIWLASDPEQADSFSRIRKGHDLSPRVIPVHASIRKPWVLVKYSDDTPYSKMVDQSVPALKAAGYDGIYRPEDDAWVAFEPEQVRSAIAPEPCETLEFDEWFSCSRVVDDRGCPLVVYHGTDRDFESFAAGHEGSATGHPSAVAGHYFSADPKIADMFPKEVWSDWPLRRQVVPGHNVRPSYLRIENPLQITAREFVRRFVRGREDARAWREGAQASGHDGIRVIGDAGMAEQLGGAEFAADAWIAFQADQVRSAISPMPGHTPSQVQQPDAAQTAHPRVRFSRAIASEADAGWAPRRSALERALAQCPMTTAPASSWQDFLGGLVKAQEIE